MPLSPDLEMLALLFRAERATEITERHDLLGNRDEITIFFEDDSQATINISHGVEIPKLDIIIHLPTLTERLSLTRP